MKDQAMTSPTDDLARLMKLSEKGLKAIQAADGTEDTSYERAAAFAAESFFRAELAKWFRKTHVKGKADE